LSGLTVGERTRAGQRLGRGRARDNVTSLGRATVGARLVVVEAAPMNAQARPAYDARQIRAAENWHSLIVARNGK
jgi:hypothetical protein